MPEAEKKPATLEELEKLIKVLNDRVTNNAEGWARDVAGINRAFGEVRSEMRKLADRIEKLENNGGLLNE